MIYCCTIIYIYICILLYPIYCYTTIYIRPKLKKPRTRICMDLSSIPSSKGTKSLLQVIKAIINRIFTDILRPTCCCTELSGLVCDHGTILLRFVFAFAYTHTHVYVDVHVCVCIRTCVCAHLCVYILEQIELPTTLLDYFLWSNKSNINQNVLTHMNCIHSD